MLRVGKGYKRLSSRSSDLRISSVARLLGVTQWLAFACATPTRLQRRHRSGFSPDSLFSPLSYCGRRSTRHDSVVIDIIRTGGAFVNGVLPDRGKRRKLPAKPRAFYGSGRRIRTLTYGVRVRCATITQSRYVLANKNYYTHFTGFVNTFFAFSWNYFVELWICFFCGAVVSYLKRRRCV